MTPRDSRGRFISANVAAAERALEAAVAEAIDLLRRGTYRDGIGAQVEADHIHMAKRTLLAAAQTAELLGRAS